MKSRLIVNPVSGTDSAPDLLPLLNERLRGAFGDVDIVMTVERGFDRESDLATMSLFGSADRGLDAIERALRKCAAHEPWRREQMTQRSHE